jgi:hypothetical protein
MNWEEITNDVEPLDSNRLAAIRERIVAETAPVTPLPSDTALIGFLTGVFVAFTFLAAFIVHMNAPAVLSPAQMTFYYGLILVSAVEGAAVVVGEMIPGSPLRARRSFWVVATALALPLVCVALFGNYSVRRFVHFGIPCFEVGSLSAAVAGLLFSLLIRKGFVASRRSAARVVAFFAALSGVAVLALHCPLLSIPHILVWHFGVLLVAWLVGDFIGRRLESR